MKVLDKRHRIMALLFGLAILVSLGFWFSRGDVNGPNPAFAARSNFWADRRVAAALESGFEQADKAAELGQTASNADQWDQVVKAWTDAIATLQTIPAQSPERFFAQRKQQEYLQNLAFAQRQANQLSWPNVFPSLGSPVLDEQLRLYLSYLATFGPPDILVIGSSRTIQGINPQILQTDLETQGYPVRVFNFSINGATAQVMNFVLQRLLTSDQLPRLVIWGDGSRAFNSRRVDATFANILKSPGYRAVLAGEKPGFSNRASIPRPPSSINAYGFLPVADVFDPAAFYQTYPRISGRYDGFYNPFGLTGLQLGSLRSLVGYLKSRNIELVYVHLPLSGDYLDDFRLPLDQRFQRFLQTQSQRQGFAVIDLLLQWRQQNAFFADPSHLNQAGAASIAQQLARDPLVLEKLNALE
ncbi:hypothetical protein [Adonisia turfae]|nr:hypothetical protein [Adonisia turfae]